LNETMHVRQVLLRFSLLTAALNFPHFSGLPDRFFELLARVRALGNWFASCPIAYFLLWLHMFGLGPIQCLATLVGPKRLNLAIGGREAEESKWSTNDSRSAGGPSMSQT
jgi:hypothetical protein